MRKRNKIFTAVITAALLLILTCAFAGTVSAETLRGSCGTDVYYEYDRTTHTLSIAYEAPAGTPGRASGEMLQGECFRSIRDEVEHLIIGEGVKKLKNENFLKFTALTDISVPESVEEIGSSTFFGLPSLETITVDPDNRWYYSQTGCLVQRDRTAAGRNTLILGSNHCRIPNDGTIKVIDSGAFYESRCEFQNGYLLIPTGVETIRPSAFYGCRSIHTLVLPDTLLFSPGEGLLIDAFNQCSNLKTVYNECSIITLDQDDFVNPNNSYDHVLPMIIHNARNADNVTSDIVVRTNYGTSYVCVWNDGAAFVRGFGSASRNSTSPYFRTTARKIVFEEGITTIAANGFSGCCAEELLFPDSLSTIKSNAFSDMSHLNGGLVIPKGVTRIESSAFLNCANLQFTEVYADDIVIGSNAFAGCTDNTLLINHGSMEFVPGSKENGCIAYYCDDIYRDEDITAVGSAGDDVTVTCWSSGLIRFEGSGSADRVFSEPTSGLFRRDARKVLLLDKDITCVDAEAFRNSGFTFDRIVVERPNEVFSDNKLYLIEESGKRLVLAANRCGIPSDGSVLVIGAYSYTGNQVVDCAGEYSGLIFPGCIEEIEDCAFRGSLGIDRIYNLNPNFEFRTRSRGYGDIAIYAQTVYNFMGSDSSRHKYLTEELESHYARDEMLRALAEGHMILRSDDPPPHMDYSGGGTDSVICHLVRIGRLDAAYIARPVYLLLFEGSGSINPNTALSRSLNNPRGVWQSEYTSGVKGVVIAPGITGIGGSAFSSYVRSLTEVHLPCTLTHIDNRAFTYCPSLRFVTSITQDNGWQNALPMKIGEHAFEACPLPDIMIGANVREVAIAAFVEVDDCASVKVDERNRFYYSWGNCIIRKVGGVVMKGCKISEIPNDGTITSITNYAFYKSAIRSVLIPEGVTYIGEYAFASTALTSLTLPSTIKKIDSYAFEQTAKITNELVIPYGTEFIGPWAFASSSVTGYLVLPETLTTLAYHSFHASKITGLRLPYSLSEIEYGTFMDCKQLREEVFIPGSIRKICAYAFKGCSALETVTFADEEPILDVNGNGPAFGLQKINLEAFMDCTSLRGQLFIPQTVEIIGERAFKNCTSLEELVIADVPAGIRRNQTSSGCSYGMEIWDEAFMNCSGLDGQLVIPPSVGLISLSAFENCTGLDGVVFRVREAHMERDGNGRYFEVPELGIREIEDYAFANCTGFKLDLTIPHTLKYLGDRAFKNCYSVNYQLGIHANYPVRPNLLVELGTDYIGTCSFENCPYISGRIYVDSHTQVESPVAPGSPDIAIVRIGGVLPFTGTVTSAPPPAFTAADDRRVTVQYL
ncbi:MAG: leucine-rich repeat domain-containing protein [Lachnospiraceae bacterium]|nr:leucine-rich repeat domain-containing protein [Lachnospiraceae bacterium]